MHDTSVEKERAGSHRLQDDTQLWAFCCANCTPRDHERQGCDSILAQAETAYLRWGTREFGLPPLKSLIDIKG